MDQSPPDELLGNVDQAAAIQQKLIDFGITISSRRDAWVTARRVSGVERRWREDTDQYNGEDAISKRVANMMDSVQAGFPMTTREAAATRSSVVVNVTRPKTSAAEARVGEMLFPTDDANWGIQPSPMPELAAQVASQAVLLHHPGHPAAHTPMAMVPHTDATGEPITGPDGQPTMRPATAGDAAKARMQAARDACDAMQAEIADQLEESTYNAAGRKMLHDAAVLGTGVLKGPVVQNQTRRAWTQVSNVVWAMEVVSELKPGSERVDPWRVFPDPSCGQDVHTGAGVFEYKPMNRKALRQLAKQPHYIPANVRRVLEEGPSNIVILNDHESQVRRDAGMSGQNQGMYEVWEYWGEFDPEDLRAANVDIPEDTLDPVQGCVVFVNQTVIKAYLNPLDSGDLPYDFFQWEEIGDSPWGGGVPYLSRAPQKVLTAAWRQAMDNAGLAVGPQVVVKPSLIQPADKQWQIAGRKIWFCNDESADVRQAFQVFEFNMHLPELEKLIELAMKFLDEESAVPKLAQGERGESPDTVGGMTILMNSANVVLRRLVKRFDDKITRPHISRYYEWNMLYNPKPQIKGDFAVDARGSSALLVRDTQQQALAQLGQFMGNQVIGPMLNWDEWVKELLKAQHIDASKILKSDPEIKQIEDAAKKGGPLDPRISAAQITAQARLQEAQVKGQTDQQIAAARIQGEQAIQKTRSAEEQAYVETEMQIAQQDAQSRIQELQLKREVAMMTLAAKQNMTLEQIKADLAKIDMQTRADLAMKQADVAVKMHGTHMNYQADMLGLAHGAIPTPTTAPAEPSGNPGA